MTTLTRRSFLTSAGLAAAATTVAGSDLFAFLPPSSRKVAVFWDNGFPAADGLDVSRDDLSAALQGLDVTFLPAEKLGSDLPTSSFHLLVLPYGSAFPRDAWKEILGFLERGGNLLSLGGVPFRIPCAKANGKWKKEVESTAYHKILGITQAQAAVSGRSLKSALPDGSLKVLEQGCKVQNVAALTYRLSSTRDYADEDGSAGQRDARVIPLVHAVDDDGHEVAAAAVAVDRLLGRFSGGRWVFAPYEGTMTSDAIRTLAHIALQGSLEASVAPLFACYRRGEVASVKVHIRRPGGSLEEILPDRVAVGVFGADGKKVGDVDVRLQGSGTTMSGEAALSGAKFARLSSGFHRLELRCELSSLSEGGKRSVVARSGFWREDRALLAAGSALTANEDFLLRDGMPFVVTGTTYMSSDVHRKFLLEPNPGAWYDDFSAMKKAGVNVVRTGVWTGWKNFMLDVGRMNEASLRGLDAFIHTARAFDIPVIFTFFAFLPERWGGVNPYFDPRALEAQKEFIGAIVRRYNDVKDIVWDFINEPSFSSPGRLWNTRPNYDQHERAAWAEWLKKTYPAPSDDARAAMLQELWRSTSTEPLSLPLPEEFNDANIFGDRRPLKAVDYRIFAQEAFADWVQAMTACVKANGGTHQLVTVGQDEGGTYERPGPQFYADAVDFTCLHNWWYNDNLLWDGIVTKAPGKANLVEETGIMFYERPDGTAWRSDQDTAELLERKLVIAVGGGGAGFIQWIWNTNPYMDSENEAAIGFLRADGSEKPELGVFRRTASFLRKHQHVFVGRQREQVLLVLPHSHMFSVRNYATEATQRAVRVLHESCGTAVRSVSEYRLDRITEAPPIIVVPSVQYFDTAAWDRLMALVRSGSTLVVTGVIDRDAHWMPAKRSSMFGKRTGLRPVASDEYVVIDARRHELTFRNEKIERLHMSTVEGEKEARVMVYEPTDILPGERKAGSGKVVWCPLPLELAVEEEPTTALYRYSMNLAGVRPDHTVRANPLRALIRTTKFASCTLYMVVNESEQEGTVSVKDERSGAILEVFMQPQRSTFVLQDANSGNMIDKME